MLGNYSTDPADYQWPANLTYVSHYIYPYLNSTDLKEASNDPEYGAEVEWPEGATDGSPQPRIAAGGGLGGNPQYVYLMWMLYFAFANLLCRLWDVLFSVTATITNNGTVPGDEVAQLYISLGGPNEPVVALRNFERLSIQPGQSATFTADITRRDVSNWDTVSQNWVITDHKKTVHVGSSSRTLLLSATLDL